MSEQQNNVLQISTPNQQAGGGNGNGHDLHARVAAIEVQLQYLATKEDIQEVKTLIEQTNTKIEQTNTKSLERVIKVLYWLLGIIAAFATSLVVALLT